MQRIRQANTWESEILTDIAVRSESYWGYDEEFMNSYRSVYKVTEEFVRSNPTYVLEVDKDILGFYSIVIYDNETSLEYFYIEPESIGKGFGRLLWGHMVESCRHMGISEIAFVTSPEAKDFYIKMGAELSCEVDSLVIMDRKIPKLIYTVK